MRIPPNDTLISAGPRSSETQNGPSAASNRIHDLTSTYLIKLGTDESGWDVLYQDPADGRLWELTYPQSGMHGGGPPQLEVLPLALAKQKYSDCP
jgi:hypothetical protein